jgi:hypothetical protein
MTIFKKESTDQAFAMMSNSYFFRREDSSLPEIMRNLGRCRVVAVVAHEQEMPEVGLQPLGSEDFDYYPLDLLSFELVDQSKQA